MEVIGLPKEVRAELTKACSINLCAAVQGQICMALVMKPPKVRLAASAATLVTLYKANLVYSKDERCVTLVCVTPEQLGLQSHCGSAGCVKGRLQRLLYVLSLARGVLLRAVQEATVSPRNILASSKRRAIVKSASCRKGTLPGPCSRRSATGSWSPSSAVPRCWSMPSTSWRGCTAPQ